MEQSKTLSLYIKDKEVKSGILDFCEKNGITISEFTTMLYRDFLKEKKSIILTPNDGARKF